MAASLIGCRNTILCTLALASKEQKMSRRAFVVVAKWPFGQLTSIGKLTHCFTGGTESHIGILIPCCTAEIKLHSDGTC